MSKNLLYGNTVNLFYPSRVKHAIERASPRIRLLPSHVMCRDSLRLGRYREREPYLPYRRHNEKTVRLPPILEIIGNPLISSSAEESSSFPCMN